MKGRKLNSVTGMEEFCSTGRFVFLSLLSRLRDTPAVVPAIAKACWAHLSSLCTGMKLGIAGWLL